MSKFLEYSDKSSLDRIYQEIKDTLEEYICTGIANMDDCWSKFEKLSSEAQKIRDALEKEKANRPNLFVISARFSLIKTYLSSEILNIIENKRYKHEDSWDCWHPFHKINDNIKDIISDFLKASGFQIKVIFLSNENFAEHEFTIDDKKEKSIIIVDTIALIEPLKHVIKMFDSKATKGVIIPEDIEYYSEDYTKYVRDLKKQYFNILYRRRKSINCPLFDKEIATENLTQQLRHILEETESKKEINYPKRNTIRSSNISPSL